MSPLCRQVTRRIVYWPPLCACCWYDNMLCARKPWCNHANVEKNSYPQFNPWQWFQFHNLPLDVAMTNDQRMFPWARPKFACLFCTLPSWYAANVIVTLAYIAFAHTQYMIQTWIYTAATTDRTCKVILKHPMNPSRRNMHKERKRR